MREGRSTRRVLDVAASGALVSNGDAASYRRDGDELHEEEEFVGHGVRRVCFRPVQGDVTVRPRGQVCQTFLIRAHPRILGWEQYGSS